MRFHKAHFLTKNTAFKPCFHNCSYFNTKIMEKKKTYVTVTILFLTYIALVFFCCLYSFSNTELDISKYFLGIRLDRYVHFTMFFPYPFSAWLFIHYNEFTKRLCNHQFIIIILLSAFLIWFYSKYILGVDIIAVDDYTNYRFFWEEWGVDVS